MNHKPESLSIQSALSLDTTQINEEQLTQALDLFERYECWVPFERLIYSQLEASELQRADYYLRLARIYYLHFDDRQLLVALVKRMLKDLQVEYSYIRDEFLPRVIDGEDFRFEAELLETMVNLVDSKNQKIEILERLCLIYEKKLYKESALNSVYDHLVKLDPKNLKALKHFKVVYTQAYQWTKVIKILKDLYESSSHENDRFRIAHELATIYNYQLDEPEAAIQVIESLCVNSPLDTTTVHYDAYYRIKKWSKCQQVLKHYLRKTDSDFEKAVIFFKLGELEIKQENKQKAYDSYQKCLDFSPDFLEALEAMIELDIDKGNWSAVRSHLTTLESLVSSDYLQERIHEAIVRVDEGLASQS